MLKVLKNSYLVVSSLALITLGSPVLAADQESIAPAKFSRR
jgi:hypothetical protein